MNIRERLGKELYFRWRNGNSSAGRRTCTGRTSGDLEHRTSGKVEAIHRRYYEAGSDVVLANTFGANVCKFHDEQIYG